ncbi:hypothetical protein GCM10009613_25450 [Pseudonocardia kongjuensis]|uniref:Uncharacterized protein n=1 Tax=Pseudonocardia kongjuensis TaxID=102227 RepID=A0ABN1XRI6_9PSEU
MSHRLLLGRGTTQIATVVERTTRFTVLVALGVRDMNTVAHQLSRQMGRLPEHVRKSLTWAQAPTRRCRSAAQHPAV